jgi:CHAT domain-containing protein/Tfp pilus assembly protein PilF
MGRHRAVTVILGICLVTWASAVGAASEDAGRSLFSHAEKLYRSAGNDAGLQQAARKYEEALAAFTKAENEDGRQKTLYQIGIIFEALNRHGKALESFERSRSLARKTGNTSVEADCLVSMARAADAMGRVSDAASFCEQALVLYEKVGDLTGQARASFRSAELQQNLGARPRALDLFDKVVGKARELKDEELEFEALDRHARLSEEMGHINSAVNSLERVLEYKRRIGDTDAIIAVLNRLGDLSRDVARWPKAGEYYRLAMETSSKQENSGEQVDYLIRLGTLDMHKGDYRGAIKHLESALELCEKLDEPAAQEKVLIHLGYIYRDLGKYSRAAECFSRALALVRKSRHQDSEGFLLTNLGRLYLDWGEQTRALACFQDALKQAQAGGDKGAQAQNELLVGKVLADKGLFAEALKHIKQARDLIQSIKSPTKDLDTLLGGIYLEQGDVARAAPLLIASGANAALGRLHLAKSEFDKAAECYRKLLDAGEQDGKADDVFTANTGLGLAYEGKGDLAASEAHYAKAVDVTEELRSSLMPAARRKFLTVRVNGFNRSEPSRGLTRVLLKQGRAADSIVPSELARARALADRLAVGPDLGYSGVPLEVQQKEAELLAKVAVLKDLRDCCSKEENPERHENLTRQIESAQLELDTFVEMLWKDYRPYAAVKYPRPVDLKRLTIPKSAYVIVFDVLGDGVGVKVLLGNEMVTSAYFAWREPEVEAAVRRFRASFERLNLAGLDCQLAQTLYSRLIAPVIPFVPKGAPIVIVPDGVLALLPFEALVVEGLPKWKKANRGWYPSGLVYFGDTHQITYHPSLTSLALHTQRKEPARDAQVLIFADPVFKMEDARAALASQMSAVAEVLPTEALSAGPGITSGLSLKRLTTTGKLADRLSRLFPEHGTLYTGIQASKANFIKGVGPSLVNYSHVVFATHGIYRTNIPGVMEPVLAMTMVPPGTDGLLRMSDVMSLAMDADLVVLAACQTGLGEYISGEGVMSIGYAFRYAGARSVLMSLWQVEETATVQLVERFFHLLKEGKQQIEALALARAEIRKLGYEHPFFWSAFVLQGGLNGQ